MKKEFDYVTPESVGISSKSIMWLLDELESGFTEPHSLMIMRYGKLCAKGWWKPFAPGLVHGQQSHSKTYTATAVGIAYTEGILSLDERIIDIFSEEAPEIPSENLKKMTVHDVLCMGTGMEKEPAPSVNWIQDFLKIPVVHEPGTAYYYNSTGSTLLGAIIKKKTGLSLMEYLKPRLFDKIGINSDNLIWCCMPDGIEVGGGGLFATTEDNLRLMKLYADGGIWEGERILAEDYVKKAISLQNKSATEAVGNPEATDNFLGYGYQIWMCQPQGVYRADGAMGQFTIVDPAKNVILAITENAKGAHWAQKTLDTIWKFLESITENSLPENKDMARKLNKRLSSLSLAAPEFHPESCLTEKISEKQYKIVSGKMHFCDTGMTLKMAGMSLPESVTTFQIIFENNEAIIVYRAGGQKKKLFAAMDGTERYQKLSNGVISKALVSAFFSEDHILELRIRWIETCGMKIYKFNFKKYGQVYIEIQGNTLGDDTLEIVKALEV